MALTLLENIPDGSKSPNANSGNTSSSNRWLKVGLGAIAGGSLVVLTGGLAATVLLPAVGTMLGGMGGRREER